MGDSPSKMLFKKILKLKLESDVASFTVLVIY